MRNGLGIQQASESEQHVICVEIPGRGEEISGMKLDALPQVEGIGQAVFGDIPAGGQTGFDFGATALELGQAVEHGFGGSIKIGAAGVLAGVEAGRAGLGTVDQRAGGMGNRHKRQEASGKEERFEGDSVHGDPKNGRCRSSGTNASGARREYRRGGVSVEWRVRLQGFRVTA